MRFVISINLDSIVQIGKILGYKEAANVFRLARKMDLIESLWQSKFRDYIKQATRKVLANARETGRLSFAHVDFTDLFMEHFRDTVNGALITEPRVRLARMPKSLKALKEIWDEYRKKGKVPKHQKSLAEKMKEAYIKKLGEVWKKISHDFLHGEETTMEDAALAMQDAADVGFSRAKIMVETETTRYFNQTRKEIYAGSDDVTHFLFMAIRDHATTKWCRSRHGLVYAKNDPLFNKEIPPIHWNCRSEILPLTPANPRHKKLIDDKSKQRRNNSCEPLPQGWTPR